MSRKQQERTGQEEQRTTLEFGWPNSTRTHVPEHE
eukprot:CAMPEP_0177673204 /NCGR_PEP_ID=MMETSP0447-20121125/25806_1 /TAXON_ID=0 /ORGANISM="Stygamoeba regulata, Strain BSH-02190019" /LENGTH=34 /DNA_ID= /DNA_START= /DNA_END= /DNA_ORIENTATION=